jgi:hypothetical protein
MRFLTFRRLRFHTLALTLLLEPWKTLLKFHPPSLRPEVPIGQAPPVLLLWSQDPRRVQSGEVASPGKRPVSDLCKNHPMEIIWYGRTCVRMRGKDAVVVGDAYQTVVGPTGRGITGEIVTYSHPDDTPHPKAKGRLSRDGSTLLPSSLEDAFVLDGPGEYEVKDVLITGVRTFRDEHKGSERGRNVAFIVELDGVHVIHLGDIGHLLTEDKLTDIGPVDVVCIPIGGALSATKAAELVAQLDAKVVVPMTVCEDEDSTEALGRFLHEMGVSTAPVPQPKLSLMPSSLPAEVTTVVLEQRGKL